MFGSGWKMKVVRGLLLLIAVAQSFHVQNHSLSQRQTTTRLSIIDSVFDRGTEPRLPKDIKDAISKCRGAVQKGLEDRLSRMDIEMPVGARFGVETNKSKKKGNMASLTGDSDKEGLTIDKLNTSNRELSRLFVEMFQPLGGDHIACVFNNLELADSARKRWGGNDFSADCQIFAIDCKGKKGMNKGKKKKSKGFAAKMAEEMDDDSLSSGPFTLPKETEVALFVAPGPKELISVERICNDLGMGTCVILLNARLSLIEKYASEDARQLFEEEFKSVWNLSAAPQEYSPGCLIHKAYPNDWLLARKPSVGPPKTIMTKEGARFSPGECRQAYESIALSDLEKGTEILAENLAGWFK